ncbi:heterocycloanthracin/sonorensin family bacteriocin [Aneurinibacillus thermoaerophilus]|uniref:heterocycloanthracin/sonorensin family bacteriocin n=1 Tax=Aneurinibacillus thermoaerophilus TaxID=143495 RepID=UPI00399C86E3
MDDFKDELQELNVDHFEAGQLVSYDNQSQYYVDQSRQCSNCFHCTRCFNCSRCSNCFNCFRCFNCFNCTRCFNCSNCTRCFNCSNCSRCGGGR